MSFTGSGPPTEPRAWSRGSVTHAAAAVSVWPYPSITGTAKTTRKNVKTSAEIGAEPVVINFTLSSPTFAFTFEKTSLSQSGWLSFPCFNPAAFAS